MDQPDRASLSFCIITAARRPDLLAAVLRSIRAQEVPDCDIVVVGRPPMDPGIRSIPAEEHAQAGRLGAMRNLGVEAARHDRIVLLDDDILLSRDWYAGFLRARPDFDILTSQIRLPDGGRYWDHATFGGPLGHRILEEHEHDDHVYMTGGGGWVLARHAWGAVRWDDARGFYEDEDTEFARRCREAGLRITHNHESTVFHADSRYTTVGRSTFRRFGNRDEGWVLHEAGHLEAPDLARLIQRYYNRGRVAEVADLLRLAERLFPGPAFSEAFSDLEEVFGGPLSDARWSPEGDPEYLETMAEFSRRPDSASRPTAGPRRSDARDGINLIGFLSGNLGLGVAARSYLRLLLNSGVKVEPVEVAVGGGRANHDTSFASVSSSLSEVTPYDVNLFVMNPSDTRPLLAKPPPAVGGPGRINVVLPFWELPRIPPSWHAALEGMDIVCAASQFIRYTMLGELDHCLVPYWPHPIYPPEGVVVDRSRWGIPDGDLLFVCAFEMASDLNRKNPLGAVEAFERAFRPGEDAWLLVKVNNPTEDADSMRILRTLAAANPRIVLLEEVLTYAEVFSLYASADAYVSLHRAEGLGLSLLESMSLGKPVIATAWSGNMDFMTETNACLVDYRFVSVISSTQAAYAPTYAGSDARWADPDLDQAAHWMRRLAEDPDLRLGIGKRAAHDVAERQSRMNADELLSAIDRARSKRGL